MVSVFGSGLGEHRKSNKDVSSSQFFNTAFYGRPYISKIEAMKLDLTKDLFIDGKISYSDQRHLSTHGEKILGKRLFF